jgi:predicted RNA-binding Zn-ribbon protein involved in translation (DUF1610 family)
MTHSHRTRLERLEHERGVGKPCPVCGVGPGMKLNYTVSFDDPDDPPRDPDNEVCPSCGRRFVYHIEFDA